jgi:hypothetical protein
MAARPTPDRRGTPSIPGSGHLERPIPTRHGRHLLPRRAWAGRSTAASSTLGRDELIDVTAGVESASLVPRPLNPPFCLCPREPPSRPAADRQKVATTKPPPPTQPAMLGEQHPGPSITSGRAHDLSHHGDQRGPEPEHPPGGCFGMGGGATAPRGCSRFPQPRDDRRGSRGIYNTAPQAPITTISPTGDQQSEVRSAYAPPRLQRA